MTGQQASQHATPFSVSRAWFHQTAISRVRQPRRAECRNVATGSMNQQLLKAARQLLEPAETSARAKIGPEWSASQPDNTFLPFLALPVLHCIRGDWLLFRSHIAFVATGWCSPEYQPPPLILSLSAFECSSNWLSYSVNLQSPRAAAHQIYITPPLYSPGTSHSFYSHSCHPQYCGF